MSIMQKASVKLFFKLTVMAMAMVWAPISLAADIRPDQVLNEVDHVRAPGEDFSFNVSLHEESTTGKPIPEYGDEPADHPKEAPVADFEFKVKVKDSVKSLVTYLAPDSSKGKKLLMVHENMWIYVPGTRNSIRISPQQQLLGQVSNADVARVVFSIDYRADSMKEGTYEEQPVWVLRLEARVIDETPFTHADLTVTKDGYRPLEARFFAPSGKLLKVTHFENYKEVLGAKRPMRLDIRDEVNGEHAVLQYSNMQIEQTPNMHFNKDYLRHLK